MIKLLGKIPKQRIWVACSGGVDSVAALDFLNRSHNVGIAFFHHRTETSDKALEFLTTNSQFSRYEIVIDWCTNNKLASQSTEEFWRDERYKFLEKLSDPIVTGHHLDDAVETYVWRMCHGRHDTIPYQRNNVIRPFLLTRKTALIAWCTKNNLQWIEDESNKDTHYTRNHIRHNVIPTLLKVNPGLHKVVAKQYANLFDT